MDFAVVFKFLVETLRREKIDFALIGGFALQAEGVTRTTRDIDLLILSEYSEKIKSIMLKQGYDLIHESEDVLNFIGKKTELGRVDFLLAHRKYTLSMLKRAEAKEVFGGKFKIKVLRPEDLIGLKVQASSNDPQRMTQDMADIEMLMRVNYATFDKELLKEYFDLFDRGKDLESILRRIEHVE